MPKIVDHAERRARIAEALVRVAAREGLHTVTMRTVAAEAGVSVSLVQYYFDTKTELLHGTLEHLERRSVERWQKRTRESRSSTRAIVEGFLAEALPADAESRAHHLVWTSYAVLAMTDSDLAAQPFVDGPNRRERELADILSDAAARGELHPGRDHRVEAARLLTLSHGLGTSVLVGQRSTDDARAVLTYHLDRLFLSPAAGNLD
ncbi:TetR/AcrR family transcriptional regulator [Amycolatopsis sp. NPDC051903]|uniref:TetR/AcrR family transcriptional regulator n=1 Tax=Amycolatopsis sp. NPDC051903 TaxID=3363936 RepID=UPI00379F19ED